jgi:hypothetical protein
VARPSAADGPIVFIHFAGADHRPSRVVACVQSAADLSIHQRRGAVSLAGEGRLFFFVLFFDVDLEGEAHGRAPTVASRVNGTCRPPVSKTRYRRENE